MPTLIWTKIYDFKTEEGEFGIHISEYKENYFCASCLYGEIGRVLKAPDQPGGPKLMMKCGTTEKDVYEQIEKWAKGKYGDGIKITERK